MSNKINEKFIDFIRTNRGIVSWVFEENDTPVFIVPENLTHDYLIKNFNIDSSIYNYYHLHCKRSITESKFQTLKDLGYIGDKETVLRPYPINIYGAYYFRPNLLMGLLSFLNSSKYRPNIQGKEIVFFDDLIPYFKEYSNGFKDGFNSFDATHINPYLNTFSDKQDYVNKVFEYITKKIFFSHWASLISGFTININNEITNAFEDGQKQGYYYKAWSYILSNSSLYAPLFQEFLKPQPIVKQKPEPNEKLITFKNNETIEKIHSLLKGYFPNKEAELLKALHGEQLRELLLFPHNQNKFVEVFRRLKYNGFLLNTDTETRNWICSTFQFVKKGFEKPQPFKESSVWDNLNKGKGEPTKKERICFEECTEWLPYKSPLQLKREAEHEKL